MKPKFFDAHTHLNMLDDYLRRPEEVVSSWQAVGDKAIKEGVNFVNIGADLPSSRLAIEQAEYFGTKGLATVGLHPTESDANDFDTIAKLAESEKVVAIGECGLEYYRIDDEDVKAKQCELFIKHIELALRLGKPLMIHCRATENNTKQNHGSPLVIDAHEDLLEILAGYRSEVGDRLKFNMHFFTGTWEVAKKFIELGGYFSFNGVITFTSQYDEVVKNLPINRIMSETDAPLVAPVPHRGERNEPAYVQYVAEHIAKLRSEPREEVLAALVQNALKFFDISPKN